MIFPSGEMPSLRLDTGPLCPYSLSVQANEQNVNEPVQVQIDFHNKSLQPFSPRAQRPRNRNEV